MMFLRFILLKNVSTDSQKFIKQGFIFFLIIFPSILTAAPQAQPGDVILRHNIQMLADRGIISSPVTTWPIAWDDLREDLKSQNADDNLSGEILSVFNHILARAIGETSHGKFKFGGGLTLSNDPMNIRGFSNIPRETSEAIGNFSWLDKNLTIDIKLSSVITSSGERQFRADGSQISLKLGNWSFGASIMDRWWGPGWDGSLILSSNARPIPSFTIGRNLTSPFESKFLRWIGPWDMQVIFGVLEEERTIANANFFGMRFNFRPLETLEIGISRSAQLCGDSRPCGFNTFKKLWLGRDNIDDGNITLENEPGNQMAGFDFRWSNKWNNMPISVYGQFIGEDEAGGLPSRYLAQVGLEGSGFTRNDGSYRWFMEWAGTSCDILKNKIRYNCAYRQAIYKSGYTYKDRIIGHGLDNDASVYSFGVVLVSPKENLWQLTGRFGNLNKVGSDNYHSVAIDPQYVKSLDVQRNWFTSIGLFKIGFGLESREKVFSGETSTHSRGFISWFYK